MSAEPMSELNSDVIDEERSGIICRTMNAAESPIVSGIKEERKASLLCGGADWSFEELGYREGERRNYIQRIRLDFIIVHVRLSHFIIRNHNVIHDITTFAQ